MSLRNSYIITLFSTLLFVFYQPIPNSGGQPRQSYRMAIADTPVVASTVTHIDTVKGKYKRFSRLVDISKDNVNTAKQQSNVLNKQAQQIAKQQKIIDSLERLKAKKSDDTVKEVKKSKKFFDNIFHIFKKKS